MIEHAIHGIGGFELVQTLARVSVGAFFTISGWHKLTNAERHRGMVKTLQEDHIPALAFNEWWVPGWEFLGGICLALGFLTAFNAAVLCIVCLTACFTDAGKRIKGYRPIDKADWLDDLLYLPEVLYVLILLPIVANGAGNWSIDRWIGW